MQELEEDLETTETKYTIAMQKYEKVMHLLYKLFETLSFVNIILYRVPKTFVNFANLSA